MHDDFSKVAVQTAKPTQPPRKPLDEPGYFFRRMLLAMSMFLMLLLIGTAGYRLLEGMELLDALYMTVITLSTVGFSEVKPLSPMARAFTIILILAGGGLAAFTLSAGVDFVFSGYWQEHLRIQRRRRMLMGLKNHVIVCGFGRVGQHVADELAAESVPFIVLDVDPDRVAHAERHGYLAMIGNAANERVLLEVGIRSARAVVAAVASDAENVFIVLTARGLNPNLFIVARANYEDSEPKLRRAGADRTILPYRISGKRMVTMLLRPNVADFLDEVVHAGGLEWILEQIAIAPHSWLVGKTLQEMDIGRRIGVTILACRGDNGSFCLPGPELVFQPNSLLIALGTREQLRILQEWAGRSVDAAP